MENLGKVGDMGGTRDEGLVSREGAFLGVLVSLEEESIESYLGVSLTIVSLEDSSIAKFFIACFPISLQSWMSNEYGKQYLHHYQ